MSFINKIDKILVKTGPALLIIFLFLSLFMELTAQEPPPRPVVVTVSQNLGFGAFSQGMAGGSVTVNSGGIRSSTGDVILLGLGYPFSAALYRVVGNVGTVVSILNGSDVLLGGSNGGSMSLHIGSSSPNSPFVITTVPPAFTLLYIGGTLTVGSPALNPPGNFSGLFYITFIQE